MFTLRHWLKINYGEWCIRERRTELQRQIGEELNRDLVLRRFGDGRADSIYLAHEDGNPVCVVRLINPYKRNFPPWPAILLEPFRRSKDRERWRLLTRQRFAALNREWTALQALRGSGATPEPLWRTRDATAVAFLPGRRLGTFLRKRRPEDWEKPLDATFRALARIHALGHAHNDAKPSNALFDPATGAVRFIDLDCAPDTADSLETAQAMDFLRLLSRLLEIAPVRLRNDGAFWSRLLAPHVPAGTGNTPEKTCLEHKGLKTLRHARDVRRKLTPLFPALDSDRTAKRSPTAG